MEKELASLKIMNLQFLNISSNNLSSISISSHNFPKLVEIFACNNKFKSSKSFTKLQTLKLLSLRNNLVEDYEDIVSLAFL